MKILTAGFIMFLFIGNTSYKAGILKIDLVVFYGKNYGEEWCIPRSTILYPSDDSMNL